MIDLSKIKENVAGKELTIGAVLPSDGSTAKTKTGGWRSLKPIVNPDKCIGCGICWMYCPEAAIRLKDKKITIDMDYCKGCGICASECTQKAIEMVKEEK